MLDVVDTAAENSLSRGVLLQARGTIDLATARGSELAATSPVESSFVAVKGGATEIDFWPIRIQCRFDGGSINRSKTANLDGKHNNIIRTKASKYHQTRATKEAASASIELPTAPDLSTLEVPPESDDDDYEGEEMDLDSTSDAESNKSCEIRERHNNTDDSSEGLTSGNAETAEDLMQNILENTGNHDFSFEWEGEESCSAKSDSNPNHK
ncbi:unnamed protein product [Phytophthora fragariaefolia]|uniref:Unnamed protein product n=1 Tax=Phytophthora fragariaefolia TaxID=1490495 RepID=A0A9W6XTE2_9STRA|nr:unnamed protein product [Phytophthora fragariaefolia]